MIAELLLILTVLLPFDQPEECAFYGGRWEYVWFAHEGRLLSLTPAPQSWEWMSETITIIPRRLYNQAAAGHYRVDALKYDADYDDWAAVLYPHFPPMAVGQGAVVCMWSDSPAVITMDGFESGDFRRWSEVVGVPLFADGFESGDLGAWSATYEGPP